MFARLIEAKAKPGKVNEIVTIFTNDVLPLLKKQSDFVDALGLTNDTTPDEGITVTLWKTKDDSEKFFNTNTEFKNIFNRIRDLTDSMTIRTCNVETSTFHRIAAAKAA